MSRIYIHAVWKIWLLLLLRTIHILIFQLKASIQPDHPSRFRLPIRLISIGVISPNCRRLTWSGTKIQMAKTKRPRWLPLSSYSRVWRLSAPCLSVVHPYVLCTIHSTVHTIIPNSQEGPRRLQPFPLCPWRVTFSLWKLTIARVPDVHTTSERGGDMHMLLWTPVDN